MGQQNLFYVEVIDGLNRINSHEKAIGGFLLIPNLH